MFHLECLIDFISHLTPQESRESPSLFKVLDGIVMQRDVAVLNKVFARALFILDCECKVQLYFGEVA